MTTLVAGFVSVVIILFADSDSLDVHLHMRFPSTAEQVDTSGLTNVWLALHHHCILSHSFMSSSYVTLSFYILLFVASPQAGGTHWGTKSSKKSLHR